MFSGRVHLLFLFTISWQYSRCLFAFLATTKNLSSLKGTFLWRGNLGITNCGSDLTSLQPITLPLSVLTRPRGMKMGTCYNLLGTTLLEEIKKPSCRVIPAVSGPSSTTSQLVTLNKFSKVQLHLKKGIITAFVLVIN